MNISDPCAICGFGSFAAVEVHRKDSMEIMYATPFCARCAGLLHQGLNPFRNPNVVHYMHTRLEVYEIDRARAN
jgi:hypothetical protein